MKSTNSDAISLHFSYDLALVKAFSSGICFPRLRQTIWSRIKEKTRRNLNFHRRDGKTAAHQQDAEHRKWTE